MKHVTATLLCTLLLLPPAFSASDSHFFNVSDNWNKRFQFRGVSSQASSRAEGFLEHADIPVVPKGPSAQYFEVEPGESLSGNDTAIAPPEPFSMNIDALRNAQGPFELELEQTATIRGRAIRRFVSTTPERIGFKRISGQEVQMKGLTQGQTVVHIWDEDGRASIPIRIIPQKGFAEFLKRRAHEVEHGSTFKAEYTQTRAAFYQGNSLETLGQTSLSYNQGIKVTGDTPYGAFEGSGQIYESANKAEIGAIYAKLSDAKIGVFEDFDIIAGDSSVRPGFITLPSYRMRGVQVKAYPEEKPYEYTAFFGRELSSIFGSLSSANLGTDSVDAFAGGIHFDYDWNEKHLSRFAYTQAYGQERNDQLNQNFWEFIHTYKPDKHKTYKSDIAFDDSQFALRLSGDYQYDDLNFNFELREISKQFFTVLGNVGGQGEQGGNWNIQWNPLPTVNLTYFVDVYRDRLFFKPGEWGRFNVKQDAAASWQTTDTSSLQFNVKDYEETALLAPYRDRIWGLAYHKRLELLGHKYSVFSRFQHHGYESLTSPSGSYRRDTVSFGGQTEILPGLVGTYSQNVSALEEFEDRLITHPRTMVYSLNHKAQIANTPLSLDTNIRYTDQEEAEATRSFLVGEDRFEVTSSLIYAIDNMEFYINGRFASIYGEDATANEQARAEGEIITGIRYLFDTQKRWEPTAMFQGIVFHDQNADGIRQEGELGVSNIEIVIGNHVAITNEDGYYQTGATTGKTANISVEPNSMPYGFSGSTPLHRIVKLVDADEFVDFGLVTRSMIGGLVFHDVNANGRLDAGERGISGAQVLLDGQMKITTDRVGRFRYTKIATGSHEIVLDVLTLPNGYLPTEAHVQNIELKEGMKYLIAFPVKAERALGGLLFADLNSNGKYDTGDTGLTNISIQLGDLITESDKNGYYAFSDIGPGKHQLKVDGSNLTAYRPLDAKEFIFKEEPKEVRYDILLNTID